MPPYSEFQGVGSIPCRKWQVERGLVKRGARRIGGLGQLMREDALGKGIAGEPVAGASSETAGCSPGEAGPVGGSAAGMGSREAGSMPHSSAKLFSSAGLPDQGMTSAARGRVSVT